MSDLNCSPSGDFNSTPFQLKRNYSFFQEAKNGIKSSEELTPELLQEQYKILIQRNKLIREQLLPAFAAKLERRDDILRKRNDETDEESEEIVDLKENENEKQKQKEENE
jgi:hypothetical protein